MIMMRMLGVRGRLLSALGTPARAGNTHSRGLAGAQLLPKCRTLSTRSYDADARRFSSAAAASSSSLSKRRLPTAVEDTPHQEQQSSFLRDIDIRSAAGQQKLSKIIQEVVVTKTNTGGGGY